jgi:hypothetical protein
LTFVIMSLEQFVDHHYFIGTFLAIMCTSQQKLQIVSDNVSQSQKVCSSFNLHLVSPAACLCVLYHMYRSIPHTSQDALLSAGVDTSAPALELARANAELNSISSEVCSFRQADIMDVMKEELAANSFYDLIVLDPPKLAPNRKSMQRALSR